MKLRPTAYVDGRDPTTIIGTFTLGRVYDAEAVTLLLTYTVRDDKGVAIPVWLNGEDPDLFWEVVTA